MLIYFSSRRRHTRLQGDWSSDVCSSDLKIIEVANKLGLKGAELQKALQAGTYAKELEKYKGMGNAANIRGTPSLFFNEIGRASCRERVEISGVAVSMKRK